MGRKDTELLESLRRSLAAPATFVHGVVREVDKAKCTCKIDVGGQVFENVSLRSIITDDTGAVLFPKTGSVVYAGFMPGSTRLVVMAMAEVEAFHVKIETTEISGNKDGVVVKRGNESLKTILSDTLDAILAMTVTTGVGPSGTPINFTQFQQLKQRLNNLLTS